MSRYRVKLIFVYSDTVEVEANGEAEAQEVAMEVCDERYEFLQDSEITLIHEED